MEKYVIKGGTPLVGEVEIGGAKNAALPIPRKGLTRVPSAVRRRMYSQ